MIRYSRGNRPITLQVGVGRGRAVAAVVVSGVINIQRRTRPYLIPTALIFTPRRASDFRRISSPLALKFAGALGIGDITRIVIVKFMLYYNF